MNPARYTELRTKALNGIRFVIDDLTRLAAEAARDIEDIDQLINLSAHRLALQARDLADVLEEWLPPQIPEGAGGDSVRRTPDPSDVAGPSGTTYAPCLTHPGQHGNGLAWDDCRFPDDTPRTYVPAIHSARRRQRLSEPLPRVPVTAYPHRRVDSATAVFLAEWSAAANVRRGRVTPETSPLEVVELGARAALALRDELTHDPTNVIRRRLLISEVPR